MVYCLIAILTYLLTSADSSDNPSPDICSLPSETGRCRAAFRKYYYDNDDKECKQFTYGGCGGNANRFNSKERCENKCGGNKTLSQQTALTESKALFDSINNGCYRFQYSRSVFLPPCYTQAIDIEIEDYNIKQVSFGVGNDIALNNVCNEDENQYNEALNDATKTINDLFNIIQDSINKDIYLLKVTYDKDTGIPFTIFIDEDPNLGEDNVFYRVNCIIFDGSCGDTNISSYNCEPSTQGAECTGICSTVSECDGCCDDNDNGNILNVVSASNQNYNLSPIFWYSFGAISALVGTSLYYNCYKRKRKYEDF